MPSGPVNLAWKYTHQTPRPPMTLRWACQSMRRHRSRNAVTGLSGSRGAGSLPPPPPPPPGAPGSRHAAAAAGLVTVGAIDLRIVLPSPHRRRPLRIVRRLRLFWALLPTFHRHDFLSGGDGLSSDVDDEGRLRLSAPGNSEPQQ